MIVTEQFRFAAAPTAPPAAGAKIGFVLLSNAAHPQPSTRISALNLFPHLRDAGYEPQIVYQPEVATQEPHLPDLADTLADAGFRAVVFQKVHGPSVERQARRLRQRGVATMFSICDYVVPSMVEVTDATLAVTEHLRGLYPAALQPRIHVVHDGIEREKLRRTARPTGRGSAQNPLKAVLVTSSSLTRLPVIGTVPDWLKVTIVSRYASADRPIRRLREVRWALARKNLREQLDYVGFLLHSNVRRVAWDPDGVYAHLAAADIGVIPIEPPRMPDSEALTATWRVKSENRLTLKMAIGLPVVATPIPAYEAVIEHGVNGFLARTERDWKACFAELRDPERRYSVGERARVSVLPRFGQAEQARRFLSVLKGVLAEGTVRDALN